MESQNIQISQELETRGFDLSAGNTWIYPENYPVRQYQYNIVKSALYHNTLVCLPTGLGKTFIAAVVMYNFWRWYPFGKIIFLAPTKPLVAQQIDACYEIMGIPSVDMIELTGAVNKKSREIAWSKKRIIFATPQVFHNDLEKLIVSSHLVKCIVIDEAHKALGKHSYCECIKILSGQNHYFRILALSATPGNKIENVHEVIQNLNISRLELRDENSIDIMPYVNKRKIDIILVPLSNELSAFKERYVTIMDYHVRFLMQCNVLQGHTANISKGRVFHLLKEFQTKTDKSGNYGQIMKTLNILLTMYHAYELMIRHGLRAFCKFYQTHSDKFWVFNEAELRDLLYDIETYLGPFPKLLPNGDISEIPTNIVFGHNKFYKLKELLEHHFNKSNGDRKDTRAIVFVEYRDIVNEIYILLLQSKPIIRPQMFVGQASQKQKQQIKALEDFRSNRVNVLISTSIGEEGLDVGEVDLIICFDVSQHSPIRLVQRMGRTGRKRDGHIIVLVTDGKEHENLKSTLSKRDSLNNKILNTSNIFFSLYNNNPRMIPNQFNPECHKIHITALPRTPNVKDKRKRKNVNKKNEVSNTKWKENLSKKGNVGQPSMKKFLTENKCNFQNHNSIYMFTQLTQNKHKAINPNNIKLLTDDNAGIEFLTLCAIKKSEEEMSSEIMPKMDEATYIPVPKPIKALFNFVVPDVKVIDRLSEFLTEDNLTQCKDDEVNLLIQCKNNENENINDYNDYNDYIDVDNDNQWCTIQNERTLNNNEIRFEDILDESSDSNETSVSFLNHRITDIEINSINTNEPSTSDVKEDDNIRFDNFSSNALEDMEPSIFENILNESFSSDEDLENKNIDKNKTSKNTKSSSGLTKNIRKLDKTNDILHNEDAKNNQNLSMFTKPSKPPQMNKFVSFINEIQDIDFNSDDDISEFVKCNKNQSSRNSKIEESSLSITQAIDEIARRKKDTRQENKEELIDQESSGWISVNINDKIEKNNENSRTHNITLSNSRNSVTTKTIKQIEILDDSDEDFMITENNVKKFNEFESCYFRNSLENTKDDCIPGISRNLEIRNGNFDNISENSRLEYTSDNALNTLKPCGMSTPKNDKCSKLSLKRNKAQQDCSDIIDLNYFKAPDKYTKNNFSKSNSDASKSNLLKLNKKIAKKNKLKQKNNPRNEFIIEEAEVDSDASSDEIVITDDEDIADFVSYTQNPEEQIDMHAHYLQAIKSPIKRPGAFHFKEPRLLDHDIQIYSQLSPQMQDSYLHDSFCVAEDAEPSTFAENDSLLDIMERELEQNRRKRPYSDKNAKLTKKKKINILNHSMSSEDEIEQLRVQVREN